MTDYCSNATMTDLAARIRAADRIALTTHAKPDGDAMGSVLALARALDADHRVDIVVVGPVENALRDTSTAGFPPGRTRSAMGSG